jgi:hypothetical protein
MFLIKLENLKLYDYVFVNTTNGCALCSGERWHNELF